MPFDLSEYEPVEDRLRAFWTEHPQGRIFTDLIHTGADGYIVKASVWRDGSEHPDATGYAQEAVTERGVNATSALENCETSAIGRALANLGYAAKGKRPSREEMSKASPTTVGEGEAPAGTGGEAGAGVEHGESAPPLLSPPTFEGMTIGELQEYGSSIGLSQTKARALAKGLHIELDANGWRQVLTKYQRESV